MEPSVGGLISAQQHVLSVFSLKLRRGHAVHRKSPLKFAHIESAQSAEAWPHGRRRIESCQGPYNSRHKRRTLGIHSR